MGRKRLCQMAEVIDLRAREAKEEKKRRGRALRRAQAVAEALACGVCPRRCAHCGMPVDAPPPGPPPKEAPYNFCAPCWEELNAFLRREKGQNEKAEAFWHTAEWAEVWRSWLANMKAREAFRRSATFLKLMEKIRD